MRKSSALLVACAAALVASLVIGPAATAGESQARGTVVFGADQEPNTLNWMTDSMYWMSLITSKITASGMIYNDKAQLVPYLLEGKPKIVKRRPFTTQHTYKATANWSDGRPLTGADYVFRWQAQMNPQNNVVTREGWDQMRSVTAKGKTVTIVWKSTYANWEEFNGAAPIPRHAFAGKDFNKMWQNEISPASGPFRFVSWTKGQQLVIARNPSWKAGPAPKLERIVFRFIPNTATQFQALRSGEVQITEPQFQLQIKDFLNDPKINVQYGPGFQYEHIDFQFGPKGHPALKQPYVRKAIAHGINRAQISQAIYGAVLPKPLPVLGSVHWMPFQPQYKGHDYFNQYKFSQQRVIDILKRAGCTGGPDRPTRGNDRIWTCPGVGKLSFRFTTTSPNQRRALTFEIIQAQLKSVGIELVPRFGPAPVVFGTVLPSHDWDIIMFTWLSSPTHNFTAGDLYSCPPEGGQNDMNYCNRRYTRLMNQAKVEVDEQKRTQLVYQAERIMANDVPTIPLYSQPGFLLHYKNIKGLLKNPTQEGSTWNAEVWSISQ
ncbi:MAG TPA: peptide ABC transporter substrate-binding protein [Gaiellaceae bacterium]|nr:peptide ABC transporter substrate-binding protein [Gaiellaceae bacterium]